MRGVVRFFQPLDGDVRINLSGIDAYEPSSESSAGGSLKASVKIRSLTGCATILK